MAQPEQAMKEAFRVLKAGGRYAFTVWASPDKHEFFKLTMPVIQTHADMSVPMPEAPPIFLYSDHDTCRRALTGAGFDIIDVVELPLVFKAASPQSIVDLLHHATVRAAALIDLQTQDVRARVDTDILAAAKAHQAQSGLDLAFPAVMAVGQKP